MKILQRCCEAFVEYLRRYRARSQTWNIHNLNKNAKLATRGTRVSRVFFGVHVIKRRSYWPESDWPELFGMTRTKDSAQRCTDHPFRGHFVSGSGGLGTRLPYLVELLARRHFISRQLDCAIKMAERLDITIVSDSVNMISLLFVFCVSLNFEGMFMNLRVWHWACCSRKNFITDFASKCLASKSFQNS